MATSRSRSLKNLEALKLQARLGPPDTAYKAVVGQSPETLMREPNAGHVTSFQGLLGNDPGNQVSGPGSNMITAPSASFGETPTGALDPSEMGMLSGDINADLASLKQSKAFAKPGTFGKTVDKASNVLGNITKYNPRSFVKDELLKKPLTALANKKLGTQAGTIAKSFIKYLL